MIGIYMIKNNINNKVYIGQSSDIKKRWKKHIEDLNNKNHHNYHLQGAWDKYGSSNFEFVILEICDKSELDKKEEFYIKKYNSLKNGYNLDNGGSGCVGYKHSKEEINKMRLSHDPVAVIQFDINFNKINEFCGGISHAAKELKYTRDCIKRCCDRSSKSLLYKNCYWVYKYEYENENFSWEKFLNFEFITNKKEKKTTNFKTVCQYDKNKNLIKKWHSYKDIRSAGFNIKRIHTICKQQKNQKTYCGYIWAYEGYNFDDGYFDSVLNPTNKHVESLKKKVYQIDINGDIVNIFNSISEAANAVGVSSSKISNAAKNKKISGKYAWVYIDDNWFKDKELLNKIFKNGSLNTPKCVIGYTLDNKIYKTYNKIVDAAKDNNTNISNIIRAIKNNKTSGGLYWKYKT